MAREILFRGKRTDNGEWVYGDLIHNCFDINLRYCVGIKTGKEHPNEVDPSTVGQFTGLLDKNGNRVFEGDRIITETGGIGYIVWEDAAFAIKSPGSEAVDWVHSSEYAKCEVVGNRFDKTELIKTIEG